MADTLARVAQTEGGALCLFALESRLCRNQSGDGSPMARYYYFGAMFDLVEKRA